VLFGGTYGVRAAAAAKQLLAGRPA
jgi:hypothetical protein